MKFYTFSITILFILKIIYILLKLILILSPEREILKRIAEKIEFIFNIGMSFLIIYTFKNLDTKPLILPMETKILFLTFGIIFILSADWSVLYPDLYVKYINFLVS